MKTIDNFRYTKEAVCAMQRCFSSRFDLYKKHNGYFNLLSDNYWYNEEYTVHTQSAVAEEIGVIAFQKQLITYYSAQSNTLLVTYYSQIRNNLIIINKLSLLNLFQH